MSSSLLALALALSLATSLPVFAGEGEGHVCKHACQPGKFEMVHATGTLFCVNCALKAECGADVDCAKVGHRMALKVTKLVDYCGETKADKAGKTLFFLDNAGAKPLLTGTPGSKYTVSGKLFENVPMIQVEELVVLKEEGGKN